MTRHARHRPSLLRRLCVLAMLALGLALQPTMAAIGELHELAHDATGAHQDFTVADAAGVDSERADADGGDGAGNAGDLHALLQYAHCCGQMPLSWWPAPVAALWPPLPADAPRMTSQLPLRARAFIPFRPPIAA